MSEQEKCEFDIFLFEVFQNCFESSTELTRLSFPSLRYCSLLQLNIALNLFLAALGGGGGSVRTEPSRQPLDDSTHKRTAKGKKANLCITEIVFSSAFQKSTFQRRRMKLKQNWATRRQHFDFPSSIG